MADKKVAEQYYSPPPKLGKWEGFKVFLWNSETSQCLGRTGASWAKIIFFYILFYSALAGFFAAMLAVFYQTLESDRPKWQLDDGLIGSNPGLGFRPMPPESNVESTLIWYNTQKPDNVKIWVNETKNFIKTYTDNVNLDTQINCSDNNPPPPGKVCKVEFGEKYSACVPETDFNYPVGSPCIFLKLNKIYNWVPDVYNDPESLPDNMPDELKKHIKGEKDVNLIWVSCEGENPSDIDNIGPINYFPRRGFPANFFPFKNTDGYMPPVVAVQFANPEKHILINIECKAWARNIHHDRSERRGSVHFELMID